MRVSRGTAFCQELFSKNLSDESGAFFESVDKGHRAITISANLNFRLEQDIDKDEKNKRRSPANRYSRTRALRQRKGPRHLSGRFQSPAVRCQRSHLGFRLRVGDGHTRKRTRADAALVVLV